MVATSTDGCLACGWWRHPARRPAAGVCPDCGAHVVGPTGRAHFPVGALLNGTDGPRLIVSRGTEEGCFGVIDADQRYSVEAVAVSELVEIDPRPRGELYRVLLAAERMAPALVPAASAHVRVTCADDPGAARRLAADAVEDARWDLLEHAALSATEQAWLRSVSAAQRGDPAALVYALLDLPEDRYAAKCALLWHATALLVEDRYLAAHVVRHLRPFAALPEAHVLLAALGMERNLTATITNLRKVLSKASITSPAVRALSAAWQVLASGPASVDRDLAALDDRLAAVATVVMSHGGPVTRRLDLDLGGDPALAHRLVDDLIDAGYSDAIDASVRRLLPHNQRRAVARRIGRIGEAQRARDQVRTAFVAGDRAGLDPTTELGRFYLLVLDLIDGDRGALAPLRELLAPRTGRLLDRLAAGTDTGPGPTALLRVPQLWPLLAGVRRERWRTAPPVGSDELAVYEWWVRDEAFAAIDRWQFVEALQLVEVAAERIEPGATRGDLLTLAACLHHQLGDSLEAFRALSRQAGAVSEHNRQAVRADPCMNPYLVLGLEPGCQPRAISLAYARRRRLVAPAGGAVTDLQLNSCESLLRAIVTGQRKDRFLHPPPRPRLPPAAELAILAELEPPVPVPSRSTQPLGVHVLTQLVSEYAKQALSELVIETTSRVSVPRYYPAN